jgi:hypothetical protein
MFHGLLAVLYRLIFARFGAPWTETTVAPGPAAMLDSAPMCICARQLFATRRALSLPGSLALLLRR